MTSKKIGDVSVNDGKGVFDNEGLCDSLICDLNSLTKCLINDQFILFCGVVSQMSKKLVNLKKGIKTDMDSLKENIEELKRMNDSLVKQMTGLPVEKDGAK